MRILLIMPRWVKKIGNHYDFPLGIAYISAVLKKHNYDVTCVNLNLVDADLTSLLRDYIQKQGIEIVCTGGGVTDYQQIMNIVSIAKNQSKDVVTIVGGALISCDPELMLRNIPMDFGVVGEGEITIVELIDTVSRKADYSNIPGIAYISGEGTFVQTAARKVIDALDSIPFPDFDGFNASFHLSLQHSFDMPYLFKSDNPRYLPMISSRSCPFSCTFCYHPLGSKYRSRSLDNFFEELDILVDKYNLNTLVVYDDLFAADKQKTLEFCERIKPYNLHWHPQLRVNNVDDFLLKVLKSAGCFCIGYGIESANDAVLKSMKKQITVSQIETALSLTYDNNIGIVGNLIFGDPAETEETSAQTLGWWNRNLKYELNLSLCIPYPGSPIYYDAVRTQKIPDKLKYIEDRCPPINISKMSNVQYVKFVYKMTTSTRKTRNFAEILSCTLTRRDRYKGPLFSLTLRCPHCHTQITYNDVNPYNNWYCFDRRIYRLACRQCNQRFDISKGTFGRNILGLPRSRSWSPNDVANDIKAYVGLRVRALKNIFKNKFN